MRRSGLKNNLASGLKGLLFLLACIACPAAWGQASWLHTVTISQDSSTCDLQIRINGQAKIHTKKGLRYFWCRNGQLESSTGGYAGSLLHGKFEQFGPDGKLTEKGRFDLGLKDGDWTRWDQAGRILTTERWKKGFIKYRETINKDTVITELFRNNRLQGKKTVRVNDERIAVQKYREGKLLPEKDLPFLKRVKNLFKTKKHGDKKKKDKNDPLPVIKDEHSD